MLTAEGLIWWIDAARCFKDMDAHWTTRSWTCMRHGRFDMDLYGHGRHGRSLIPYGLKDGMLDS